MPDTDFENFYTEKLVPALPRLRAECRQADAWHLVIVLACILGFGCFIAYFAEVLSGVQASWLFALFAATAVFALFIYAKRNDRFTASFKAAIIRSIMDDVCPGLVYKPGEMITSREYKASSLYRYRYDYFDGDDLIAGTINGVSFRCSELHIRSDYAGGQQVTVFKGLFFVAKINKRFSGGTYVWQRNRAQLSTSIMDEGYRLFPMPHTVDIQVGDHEFDECFRFCSTSPWQANEICSAAMRENMLRVFAALKGKVSFSFVAGRCFIAVPVVADLLEPGVYDPGDKIEIGKYFNTIRLIKNMIRQLDLAALQ